MKWCYGFIFLLFTLTCLAWFVTLNTHNLFSTLPISTEQKQFEDEFVLLAKKYNKTLKPYTIYKSIDGVNSNMCVIIPFSNKRIVYIDANASKRVVFHEIGHCALGLEHSVGVLENGFPSSWMMQLRDKETEDYLLDSKNEEYYKNEIFTRNIEKEKKVPEVTMATYYGLHSYFKNHISKQALEYYYKDFFAVGILCFITIMIGMTLICKAIKKISSYLKAIT